MPSIVDSSATFSTTQESLVHLKSLIAQAGVETGSAAQSQGVQEQQSPRTLTRAVGPSFKQLLPSRTGSQGVDFSTLPKSRRSLSAAGESDSTEQSSTSGAHLPQNSFHQKHESPQAMDLSGRVPNNSGGLSDVFTDEQHAPSPPPSSAPSMTAYSTRSKRSHRDTGMSAPHQYPTPATHTDSAPAVHPPSQPPSRMPSMGAAGGASHAFPHPDGGAGVYATHLPPNMSRAASSTMYPSTTHFADGSAAGYTSLPPTPAHTSRAQSMHFADGAGMPVNTTHPTTAQAHMPVQGNGPLAAAVPVPATQQPAHSAQSTHSVRERTNSGSTAQLSAGMGMNHDAAGYGGFGGYSVDGGPTAAVHMSSSPFHAIAVGEGRSHRSTRGSERSAPAVARPVNNHSDHPSSRAKTPSVVNVSLHHSNTSTPKTEPAPAPHHPNSHHVHAASVPRSTHSMAQHDVSPPRRTPVPSTYSASAASMSSFGGGRGGADRGGMFSGPPSTIGEEEDASMMSEAPSTASKLAKSQSKERQGRDHTSRQARGNGGTDKVDGVGAMTSKLQAQVAALSQQLQSLYLTAPQQQQQQQQQQLQPAPPQPQQQAFVAPPSPAHTPCFAGPPSPAAAPAPAPPGPTYQLGIVPPSPQGPPPTLSLAGSLGSPTAYRSTGSLGPGSPLQPWSSPAPQFSPHHSYSYDGTGGLASGGNGGHMQPRGRVMKHSNSESAAGSRLGPRRGSSPEKGRLRKMVDDLRVERMRLEDRLYSDDPQSEQRQRDTRDMLEKQVLELTRERDSLDEEAERMLALQEAALSSQHEAGLLRAALWEEQQRTQQLQSAGGKMGEQLVGITSALETLAADHKQAMSSLTNKNETLATQNKKLQQQLKEAVGASDKASLTIKDLKREVESKSIAHSQAKAANEVMQNLNHQLQSQLGSSSKELQSRCASMAMQLQEVTRKTEQAQAAQATTKQELAESQAQGRELASRVEYLRVEREKLLKIIAGEQAAGAAAKQSLESLAARVRASEESHSGAEASLRSQMHALAMEHAEQIAQLKQQYEAQLSVTDQEAQACLRKAESTQASSSKLVEVHNALRRERDELWSRAEELRSSLAAAVSERDDLMAKVSMLRSEAKAAVSDLKGDRELRLQNEHIQHQAAMSELKMQHERALLAQQEAHEHQMAGVLALAERLKNEVTEAQRTTDKHKGTIANLKDQIKEVLVVRDVIGQELASERQYNSELSQVIAQFKGVLPGRSAPIMPPPTSEYPHSGVRRL